MNAVAEILPPATDIVAIVEETPQVVLLDAEKFDQFYARVKIETDALVADVSTKKGRDEIRSMAAKVTRSKTAIDKAGLALTKQWRDQTNQVNAARKEIEARLTELADDVRRPLTEWEEAEKARIEFADSLIASFKAGQIVTLEDTAASVRERGKAACDVIVLADTLGDKFDEVQAAKDACVEALKAALARLTREEEERAELEKLRAEKEERDRIEAERVAAEQAEREATERAKAEEEVRVAAEKKEAERIERLRQEAADKARREAEEQAQREREEADRAKQAEIDAANERARQAEQEAERQRQEAARAEQERQRAAEAEAAEQKRRDEDRAHRGQVMGAAKQAIMTCGTDEETAKKIVLAIIAGEVPAVSLRF